MKSTWMELSLPPDCRKASSERPTPPAHPAAIGQRKDFLDRDVGDEGRPGGGVEPDVVPQVAIGKPNQEVRSRRLEAQRGQAQLVQEPRPPFQGVAVHFPGFDETGLVHPVQPFGFQLHGERGELRRDTVEDPGAR